MNYRDFEFEEHKRYILDLATRMLPHNVVYWCAALGGSAKQMNVGDTLLDILVDLKELHPDTPPWHRVDLIHHAVAELVRVLAYCQTHCCPFTEPQSEILEDIYKKLETRPRYD